MSDFEKDKEIEQLKQTINSLKQRKKFGLVFEEISEKIVDKVSKEIPYLERREDKSFVVDAEKPTHTLIKGDNFPALLTLLPEYKNSIDVIYIDPPYNTGNKDFIYNDDYVDKESGWRHSKWLSFMKRRLELAKKLLSDSGVIFVSIDDNEQAHLKMLMDEIFGADNFMGNMVRKTAEIVRTSVEFQKPYDYVLIYRKKNTIFKQEITGKKEYPFEDSTGKYRLVPFWNTGPNSGKESRPNLWYDFWILNNGKIVVEEPESYSKKVSPTSNRWMWGKPRLLKDQHLVVISKDNKPYTKRYENTEDINSYAMPKIWSENFKNGKGSKMVSDILGKKIFDYAKPIELNKWLTNLHPNTDATVLDFFAGSGTTGHAVAALNEEDGGNRKCILVTDAGKTGNAHNDDMSAQKEDSVDIADDVTYERMRRVLTGEDWANPSKAVALNQNLDMLEVKFIPKTQEIETYDDDFNVITEELDINREQIISEMESKDYTENEARKLYSYWEEIRKGR